MEIHEAIEDEASINFIKKFEGLSIGAISIAPILPLKAGLLGKRFMAGINVEDLLEEGFAKEDLKWMTGWDESLQGAVSEGYIISGNIVSLVF